MKMNMGRQKLLGTLAFVAGAIVLGWFRLPVGIFAVSVVALAVIYMRIDQIVEFSFGPLKAKLERNLSESEVLVDRLRKLAALQATVSVSAGVRAGRWSGEDDWLFVHVKELEGELASLGVSPDDLKKFRAEFVKFTLSDIRHAVLGGSTAPLSKGTEAMSEWKELRQGLDVDPDRIEAWLKKWGAWDESRQPYLDALRWIASNQDVLDRDQYMLTHERREVG